MKDDKFSSENSVICDLVIKPVNKHVRIGDLCLRQLGESDESEHTDACSGWDPWASEWQAGGCGKQGRGKIYSKLKPADNAFIWVV